MESELNRLQDLVEKQSIPVPAKKEFKESISEIHKTFANFQKDANEEYEILEIAERAYRNLASLGISTASTAHEIINLISNSEEIPDSIETIMDENAWGDKRVEEELNAARNFFELLKHYAGFNRSFVQTMAENVQGDKAEEIVVSDILSRMKETFTKILSDDYDITCKIEPPTLSIHMNKADFLSVILNLLANSLNALNVLDKSVTKKIKIEFYRTARSLKIQFSDNGKGVSDNNKNKIFDLFFTTRKQGTGLGLSIIKEIVELHGGRITLSASSELEQGATFIIEIPWEKVNK